MDTLSHPEAARYGSGQAIPRVEDAALLAGKGRFVDNVLVEGTTHIAFLRSPYAHARIVSIDASAAERLPGVLAVYTGAKLVEAGVKPIATVAGFKRPDGSPAVSAPRHVLAVDTVRFVGEAVAAVVAETREAARDAAEAIVVDYDELQAVVDPVAAMRPGAPALFDAAPDNVSAEMRHGNAEAAEAAFAKAAHTVSLDIVNQRLAPSPMEPRGIVAAWGADTGVADAPTKTAPGGPVASRAAASQGADAASTAPGAEADLPVSAQPSADATPRTGSAAAAGAVSSQGAGAPGIDPAARLTVRISSQMPTGVRATLVASIPGLTDENVRVVVGDVGGGFGMKTGAHTEDIVVAYAAKALGRPVRWQADRVEEFLSAIHGRDVVSRAEMALDADGKVLALRVRSLANVGAYAMGTGVAIQLLIGPWVSTSIYDITTIDLRFTAVMTNTMPTGAYRGAGRPEAIYLTERLFDAAAREMRLDPAELRRRNLIAPDKFPYKNAMGQTYDSGAFAQILDQGLALADWSGFDGRRAASEAKGKLRGRGLASFLEWTGGNAFEERVTVEVSADGTIEIGSATQAMGQGIQTSYVQLAVDVFGVTPDKVRIKQGDTDRANGFGSAGSRSLFTGGSAVKVASERTVDQARILAGEALEVAAADLDYREGRFEVAGTDLAIGLFELAGRQADARIYVDSTSTVGGPTWPNGCHVCEVEIDPETGHVDVASYASVNDIGRVVSPAIVTGQVEGGAVQGIGQALTEHVVYDPASGQLLTASYQDYAMPRADVATAYFKTKFDTSIPCKTNLLGVKGVGELGTIGATPAVVNAVVDALDHAGRGRDAERIQMPVTPQKVWRALAGEFEPSPFAGAA